MADPLIRAFLDKVETDEILPIVPPVPGQDLAAYKTLIMDRFSNAEVADTERRLCFDGSNRQPKFVIPSIRDNLAKGNMPKGLVLECALWCRYCAGTEESGQVIEPNDPIWDVLVDTAHRAKDDPITWLNMRAIYGDLADHPAFVAEFANALHYLWSSGVDASIQRYLEGV